MKFNYETVPDIITDLTTALVDAGNETRVDIVGGDDASLDIQTGALTPEHYAALYAEAEKIADESGITFIPTVRISFENE